MFKYILLFLILIILLGHQQLIDAMQSLHNNLVGYDETAITNNDSKMMDSQKSFYQKDLTLRKITKWQVHKRYKGESFFSWLSIATMENNSWKYYKKMFLSEDGRVIDPLRDSVSTSEGQAYVMRRALIMKDKVTFDKAYNWAKYNLQHKHDKLFAWLWGQKNIDQQREIEYGIIDQNSASDADIEISVCLIFAYKLWDQENYINDAFGILKDIWDKETIEIKGERILISGVNQNRAKNVEVNPSYFMIYSFRMLSDIDKEHDWNKLVNSSYGLTNWCIDHIESGLPPDIFYINRKTGVITFDKDKSDFSYDAVRVFYRFYVDYIITGDLRAEKLLSKSQIFSNRWRHEKKFYTNYKQNGELKNYDEAIGSIALILPAIKMYDKNVAAEIYKDKIKAKYHREGYWEDPLNYYAQNLVWFGYWLYQNEDNIRSFKY